MPFLQLLSAALLLGYAGYWRMQQSKRRSESWDEIVRKLRPNDWSCARGIWMIYCNASVLVQLADYAAEYGNGKGVPEELLESIRSDAFHIRICALKALVYQMFSSSPAKNNDASSVS